MVNSRGDQVNIALLHLLHNYGKSATRKPDIGTMPYFYRNIKKILIGIVP